MQSRWGIATRNVVVPEIDDIACYIVAYDIPQIAHVGDDGDHSMHHGFEDGDRNTFPSGSLQQDPGAKHQLWNVVSQAEQFDILAEIVFRN